MRWRFRLANPEDAAVLASISEASLVYSWNERDFTETMQNRQAKVFVCEQISPLSLLGYVVLYHAADEGEIASVGVHPLARRQGIGRGMMDFMLESCLDFGVRKLFLEVRESNEPAQKLYESTGFLRVGVRKNFYDTPKEDAFIMTRTI